MPSASTPASIRGRSQDLSSEASPQPTKRARSQAEDSENSGSECGQEMRLPLSWNDRSLLQDEPFRTWFTIRAKAEDDAEVFVNGQDRGESKGKGKNKEDTEGEKKGVDWGKKMAHELRGNFGVSLLSDFLSVLSRLGSLFIVYEWT